MSLRSETLIIVAVMAAYLFLSNVYSGYFEMHFALIHVYNYKTADGKFQFAEYPEKGRDLAEMHRSFRTYLQDNPETTDSTIYRTFRPNLWRYWNWRSYLTHERYKYPYMK